MPGYDQPCPFQRTHSAGWPEKQVNRIVGLVLVNYFVIIDFEVTQYLFPDINPGRNTYKPRLVLADAESVENLSLHALNVNREKIYLGYIVARQQVIQCYRLNLDLSQFINCLRESWEQLHVFFRMGRDRPRKKERLFQVGLV